ncbi:hypothetical protein OEZ85_010480 [Tetradesmus obliquus]|uniref:Phosphatidylinositol-specific phospholipase C X domain-containing protein n=1 Tax=Tetradesmus obliquus TaxID=3088 RepID=A0ABY8TMF7_TETOB|nr:hypothetical protein OEZ85_010480 [Tetradesmus obliquus]
MLWDAEQQQRPQQQVLQLQQQQQPPRQSAPAASSGQLPAPAAQVPAASLQPQGGWMGQCCAHKRLQEMYLPGTHDSGTGHPWTVPQHLPLVVDEVAAVLFNIVGDLSRTQHLSVYEQLQAGARVLDIRLAVNPWFPLQQRLQQQPSARSSSSRSQSSRASQQPAATGAGRSLFRLDGLLQGHIDLAAAGGPLTAAELAGSVVISHSLPGSPLGGVLADVARFLREQPSEVVVMLVKGDTVDVNVAGIQRMTPQAWGAAADIFRRELADVAMLTQQQVEQQTLGELAASAPQGSLLLYGRELRGAGLPCLLQPRLLESWGNGTNTEELPDLKAKLLQWLTFWQASSNQAGSYLLLASAEVTLGVRTILQLLRRRLWTIQQQQHALGSTGSRPQQQQQQQHAMRQQQAAALQHVYDEALRLGAVRTLYDLGQATNAELLRDILQDSQVPKSFNVWSLDALGSDADIVPAIIRLNSMPAPS